jgi:hypothetical protein
MPLSLSSLTVLMICSTATLQACKASKSSASCRSKAETASTKLHAFFGSVAGSGGLEERIEAELQQLAASLLVGNSAGALDRVNALIRGGDGTGLVGQGVLCVKQLAGCVKMFTAKEAWVL